MQEGALQEGALQEGALQEGALQEGALQDRVILAGRCIVFAATGALSHNGRACWERYVPVPYRGTSRDSVGIRRRDSGQIPSTIGRARKVLRVFGAGRVDECLRTVDCFYGTLARAWGRLCFSRYI